MPDEIRGEEEEGRQDVEFCEAEIVLEPRLSPQDPVLPSQAEHGRAGRRERQGGAEAVGEVQLRDEEAEAYGVSEIDGEGKEKDIKQGHE